MLNEFHEDEAAQTGQRPGADAEEEKETCNGLYSIVDDGGG